MNKEIVRLEVSRYFLDRDGSIKITHMRGVGEVMTNRLLSLCDHVGVKLQNDDR